MSRDREYTDAEVKAILRRAAELQQHEPSGTALPRGTSLTDLEEAAQQAGIDPLLVRRAAGELDARSQSRQFGLAKGLPGALRVERPVSGEVTLESLAPAVRNALGSTGDVRIDHGALTWQHAQRRVAITFSRGAGGHVLRIEESLQRLGGAMFGGIMGGMGGGLSGGLVGLTIGLGSGPVLPIALAAVTLGASFGAARWLFLREVRKRSEQLIHLADSLAERRA
ncbi:MAG: hypothetical protein ACRENP_11545 [Longimicrobiales bacterium]